MLMKRTTSPYLLFRSKKINKVHDKGTGCVGQFGHTSTKKTKAKILTSTTTVQQPLNSLTADGETETVTSEKCSSQTVECVVTCKHTYRPERGCH